MCKQAVNEDDDHHDDDDDDDDDGDGGQTRIGPDPCTILILFYCWCETEIRGCLQK